MTDTDSIWIRRMQALMGLPRPLLRWVRDRSNDLNAILPRMPSDWNRYVEPFAGGLSVFLALYRDERVTEAVLGDTNYDLMDTYRVVRKHPHLVLSLLRDLRPSRALYEKLCLIRRTSQWMPQDAARFIFLNQLCHNGLYRLNDRGEFCVPLGKAPPARIYDEENIATVAQALQRAVLYSGSCDGCLHDVRKGDFVFCDPPENFSARDHGALLDTLHRLTRDGIRWMVYVPQAERTCWWYRKHTITRVAANGHVVIRNY